MTRNTKKEKRREENCCGKEAKISMVKVWHCHTRIFILFATVKQLNS